MSEPPPLDEPSPPLPPALEALGPERLQAWRALSDLFLDTELLDDARAYMATQLAPLPLSLDELDAIVWYELGPGLGPGLMSMTGEWALFSDEDLARLVRPVAGRRRAGSAVWRAVQRAVWGRLIADVWPDVRDRVAAARR